MAGVVHQMQRYAGFAQQLDIQVGEHGTRPPGLMLELLDQQGERLFAQVHQDLVQGMLHPHHFSRDCDAVAPHRLRLVFQPLPVLLHVTFAHHCQRLVIDQARRGKPFHIIESHDVQRHALGLGQGCGSVVDGVRRIRGDAINSSLCGVSMAHLDGCDT